MAEWDWEAGYVDTPILLEIEGGEDLIPGEQRMEMLRESAAEWAQARGGELAQGPVRRIPGGAAVHYLWPVVRPVVRRG